LAVLRPYFAASYEVHRIQVGKWKKQLLDGSDGIFESTDDQKEINRRKGWDPRSIAKMILTIVATTAEICCQHHKAQLSSFFPREVMPESFIFRIQVF